MATRPQWTSSIDWQRRGLRESATAGLAKQVPATAALFAADQLRAVADQLRQHADQRYSHDPDDTDHWLGFHEAAQLAEDQASRLDGTAHTYIDHENACSTREHGGFCQFCDGGLTGCSVCDSFEGMFTTDCPGEPLGHRGDAVYAGTLDYYGGEWIEGRTSWRGGAWSAKHYSADGLKSRQAIVASRNGGHRAQHDGR